MFIGEKNPVSSGMTASMWPRFVFLFMNIARMPRYEHSHEFESNFPLKKGPRMTLKLLQHPVIFLLILLWFSLHFMSHSV